MPTGSHKLGYIKGYRSQNKRNYREKKQLYKTKQSARVPIWDFFPLNASFLLRASPIDIRWVRCTWDLFSFKKWYKACSLTNRYDCITIDVKQCYTDWVMEGKKKMVNQEKASGTDKTGRNARLPNRLVSETLSLGITYIRARYKEWDLFSELA